jgi:hypothetical protein
MRLGTSVFVLGTATSALVAQMAFTNALGGDLERPVKAPLITYLDLAAINWEIGVRQDFATTERNWSLTPNYRRCSALI